MATLKILGILELDLEKIVKVSREFLSKDTKAKDAIIGFIDQTEKAYGGIVKSIAPFYKMLYTDETFSELFPAQFSSFMGGFYNDSEITEIMLRCSDVQKHLQKLDTDKPSLSKEKFQDLIDTWILMRNEFESNLRGVSNLYQQEARKQLQIFVSDTRDSFERIQNLLSQLNNIKQILRKI